MSFVSGRQEATVRSRMMTAPPRTSTFQKIDFHTPPLCEKPFTMVQMLSCSKLDHCEGLFFPVIKTPENRHCRLHIYHRLQYSLLSGSPKWCRRRPTTNRDQSLKPRFVEPANTKKQHLLYYDYDYRQGGNLHDKQLQQSYYRNCQLPDCPLYRRMYG